jgi:sulfoxide reductase heme-binding subunit YedZ
MQLTHATGQWGLRFLLASLAVTPLRRGFGWSGLAPYRRSFGLIAFSYASLHLLVYLGLDQGLAWDAIWEDVLERRFITMGFAAFCCLLPLALTSTRASIRRLGRRWVQLHRLAYVAGICAAIHFIWLVKADLLEPLIYALILAGLLGARVWRRS